MIILSKTKLGAVFLTGNLNILHEKAMTFAENLRVPSLAGAPVVDGKLKYNEQRSRKALGGLPLAQYAERLDRNVEAETATLQIRL